MADKALKDDSPFITRDAHKRVIAEYRMAHTLVIRREAPDLDTALSIIRD